MRIVFFGGAAAPFFDGFAAVLAAEAGLGPDDVDSLTAVAQRLDGPGEREAFIAADVIVGAAFHADLPRPRALRLLHVPGAGTDRVDLAAVPPGAAVCNCFGHERSMAEYVMAGLLLHEIPIVEADAELRRGLWRHGMGTRAALHGELGSRTLGIVGFGHIGRAVASLARAFGMAVHVVNRSPVAPGDLADRVFAWTDLPAFWGSVDALVITVPLTPDTRGLVDHAAFAAMRPNAVLVNVARGPVVEEAALYEALRERRIAHAVIDTWYAYPAPGEEGVRPAALPFHELTNIVMTPHFSGWTREMHARRQRTMAANIGRLRRGEALAHVVRAPSA